MLYTIGKTESYEKGLDEEKPLLKLGKCIHKGEPYDGGIVFLSEREAYNYLLINELEGYSVYGLVAELDDTVLSKNGLYRNLVVNAQIVRLIKST